MENIQGLSCGRTSPEPSRPTKGKISGQSSRRSAPSMAGGSCSYASKGKWANAGKYRGRRVFLAWRVLDAQFWGVPSVGNASTLSQIFAGRRAGKILFESEGVSGYSAEGFRAWQGAARHTEKGLWSGRRRPGSDLPLRPGRAEDGCDGRCGLHPAGGGAPPAVRNG